MAHRTKLAVPKTRTYSSPLDKAKAHEVVWPQVSELFEMTRRVQDMSYVYVIGEHDDGPLKIGVAKDPIGRLRSMQTGNPRRLRVEFVLIGDMALEKVLHEFWEPFAIRSLAKQGKVDAAPGTEWFRPECRERLAPILSTAVENQIDYMVDFVAAQLHAGAMERIVRDAHYEHGFVPKGREEVRLLAAGAGYVNAARPSRI